MSLNEQAADRPRKTKLGSTQAMFGLRHTPSPSPSKFELKREQIQQNPKHSARSMRSVTKPPAESP
jgi:hypothetical protein